MFVEVVRLLIVTLFTAAGYELARHGGADPGSMPALGATIGALIGYVAGGVFGRLLGVAGLSARTPASFAPEPVLGADAVLADTSALIDGRLAAVAAAGFLRGPLLVPRFVLDEVQAIADAADETRRRRGRRALETLDGLRRDGRVGVTVVDHEVPELESVDAKLTALARRLRVDLLTTDYNLQKGAELQGVRC